MTNTPSNHSNKNDSADNKYACSEVSEQLSLMTRKLKRKAIIEQLMLFSPIACLLAYVILYQFNFSLFSLFVVLGAVPIGVSLLTRTAKYRQINQNNLLEHLNRQFPQLEESAQLLVAGSESLPLLSALQQERIKDKFLVLLADKTNKTLIFGHYRFKSHLMFALAIVVSCFVWKPLMLLNDYINQGSGNKNILTTDQEKNSQKNGDVLTPVTLLNQKLQVVPPAYTGLSSYQTTELNIKAVAGTRITWQIQVSQPELPYMLVFSNGKNMKLLQDGDKFTAEASLTHTSLYQIKAGTTLLPQIYTLEVINDQRPVIRILTPKLTITELAAANTKPTLSTKVQVRDDFGLSKVDILASIAKGSGESVKFRDQEFEFDQRQTIAITQKNSPFTHMNEYQKMWDLTALAMEPGDELYFTVRAWDNKKPEPQLTHSITKIVRWLEDSEQAVMAEGILIDFLPEYFKSQRQIIIETEQLIADRDQLLTREFSKTSELLGVAQSELKHKYGQYLGDEFEDGGNVKVAAAQHQSTEAENDDHHEGNEHEESEHESTDHNDHLHGTQQGTEAVGVQSAYQTVLAKYAHNHEDSDVGLMGKQDPVALMKRSVANMWEAELYLMLSKPEQALPYEKKALKFLKMAKKAERIYVKRLGFEPPPVNEDRRYQGELDEIASLSQSKKSNVIKGEYHTLSQAFSVLNAYSPVLNFTQEQRELLSQVKTVFTEKLSTRPALIEFVATIEKLLLANKLTLIECDSCVIKLRNKIWQIMPEAKAIASATIQHINQKEVLSASYLNQISQATEPASKEGKQ